MIRLRSKACSWLSSSRRTRRRLGRSFSISTRPMIPCTATRRAGSFTAMEPALRRPKGRPGGLLLLSAAVRVLRPAPARGQAPALEHRCLCRRGGRGRTDRRPDPRPLATGQDHAARGFRLCPGRTDGVVRSQRRRLRLRSRAQRAPGRCRAWRPDASSTTPAARSRIGSRLAWLPGATWVVAPERQAARSVRRPHVRGDHAR